MSDSESSALSSPPPSDDEMLSPPSFNGGRGFGGDGNESSEPAPEPSPSKKRPASPPHEEVLADNPDIAFIVMFRSRFSDALPPKLPQVGPQDIERGVVDPLPSPTVESLLCAFLGLVLNRKKPVERGHYGRALEEALQTNRHQWPRVWNGVNPISGGRSFNTMNPQERLTLLRYLAIWSLHSSEVIAGIIKESYKQNRHEDDLNQPLSVQPWGRDGDKRRYWLIEGRDDTSFRLYRESNPALKNITWRSVAGSIEELREVAQKLRDDGTQAARRLADRIMNAIPRFEATEEKRKRREYRLARKAQFARPEPGFSLYEGRTRGKRMKYTFSDEEDYTDESGPARRSTRQSGRGSPIEPPRPTVTSSGRQVRSRMGGTYGETLLSGQTTTGASPATGEYEQSEISEPVTNGRGARAGNRGGWRETAKPRRRNIEGYNSIDEMTDEDATSWDGGDEDDNDNDNDDMQLDEDEDEGVSDDASEDENGEPKSLIVSLRYASADKLSQSSIHDEIKLVPRTLTVEPAAEPKDESEQAVESAPSNGTQHQQQQFTTNGTSAAAEGDKPTPSLPDPTPAAQFPVPETAPPPTKPAFAPPPELERLAGKGQEDNITVHVPASVPAATTAAAGMQ